MGTQAKRAFLWTVAAAIPAAGVGLLVALLLMPAVWWANYHSIGYRKADAAAAVRAAFASGELQDDAYLTGDTDRGIHQFNDCLILYQAIDQAAPKSALATSPLATFDDPCRSLRALADGTPQPQAFLYHRYIHGHTIVARYALPHISVSALRAIYKSGQTLILAIGIGLALVHLVSGRGRRLDHLFWLVTFGTLARWFGLESFGQSLGHGPADMVLLAFLLSLYVCRCMGGAAAWVVAPLGALFGLGTIVFEFLTGGIPLGWAVLIGALPFALPPDTPPDRMARAVLSGIVAFSTTVAAAMGAKLWLVWQNFGSAGLHSITDELAVRTGLVSGGEQADISLRGFVEAVWRGSGSLAVGMHLMSALAIFAALACGAWGLWRLARDADGTLRMRAWLLAGSNGAILLWIALFSQHFIVHCRFMDRMFAWTLASGFALFALALWRREAEPASPAAHPTTAR
ncbi:hypothetical protein [Sphingomonas oryzagri]|uniref:Transmembrane protein n=1 Tax=Sphingomonas oryzagri TaxID=3042314 RepID=A0ABT6MYI3_9SPHN|nr:hypothetical protein [Sphingomonas oryzagri]MDH7637888.1 hypothetical protein [Sphingomonas oryzagri]